MKSILGFHYLLTGLSRPKKSVQLDQGWPRNLVGLSLVAAITLFSSPTLTSGAYNFSWSAAAAAYMLRILRHTKNSVLYKNSSDINGGRACCIFGLYFLAVVSETKTEQLFDSLLQHPHFIHFIVHRPQSAAILRMLRIDPWYLVLILCPFTVKQRTWNNETESTSTLSIAFTHKILFI
jgi:hypothetical protein